MFSAAQERTNPNPKYPPVYVGNHVPTLGEARGKLVILTDINVNYYWNDVGVKAEAATISAFIKTEAKSATGLSRTVTPRATAARNPSDWP